MGIIKVPGQLRAVLAGILLVCSYAGPGVADEASDNAALKEQMRILMQRIDDLSKQVDALQKQQAATQAAPPGAPASIPVPGAAPPPPAVAKQAPPPEPKFEKFLKGFYGTLDVSLDDTTKGINGLTAYSYSLVNPNNPSSGYVNNGPKGQQQIGRLGYMPALSTNKSLVGYHTEHKIGDSDVDFIIQVETALAITASPGLRTSYTQQSNVVQGAIGLGDTFVGLQDKAWGKIKFGTVYAPYKRSTDRMNPFSGMLGDYAVIMGNTGGDNRVEFGTRLDHSLWYESPKFADMFSFDVLWSPGANRTFDNATNRGAATCCSTATMAASVTPTALT